MCFVATLCAYVEIERPTPEIDVLVKLEQCSSFSSKSISFCYLFQSGIPIDFHKNLLIV